MKEEAVNTAYERMLLKLTFISHVLYTRKLTYTNLIWSFQQPCAEDIMILILQVKKKVENRKECAQSCKADLCLRLDVSNFKAHSFPMRSALYCVCYNNIYLSCSYLEMHKPPGMWIALLFTHIVSIDFHSFLGVNPVPPKSCSLVVQAEKMPAQ